MGEEERRERRGRREEGGEGRRGEEGRRGGGGERRKWGAERGEEGRRGGGEEGRRGGGEEGRRGGGKEGRRGGGEEGWGRGKGRRVEESREEEGMKGRGNLMLLCRVNSTSTHRFKPISLPFPPTLPPSPLVSSPLTSRACGTTPRTSPSSTVQPSMPLSMTLLRYKEGGRGEGRGIGGEEKRREIEGRGSNETSGHQKP